MLSIDTRPRRGFTLVEVMVALGITAGAMILLMSVNRNALQRTLRAQDRIRLEHACESKLDAILCGSETSLNGSLDALPGYSWSVQQEPAGIEGLVNLQRVTVTVRGAAGAVLSKTSFHYGPLKGTAAQPGAGK